MYIKLPEKVQYILRTLLENGFEAFVVGGCVRDSLLNKVPKDWDITTNANPQDIKNMFVHTIETGEKYGTITVVIGNDAYEITTYRIDGNYINNRYPDSIEFTSSLGDDLRRRDFSINAMAYNQYFGLIDLYDGKEDLDNKIIRCVGHPINRFSEDYLRIIRCYRFAITHNFKIEKLTYQACKSLINKKCLKKLSKERIQRELDKILESDMDYNGFKLFMEIFVSIMSHVIGYLNWYDIENMDIFNVFNSLDKEDRLAWILYNYTSSVEECYDTLVQLKYPNKICKYIYDILTIFNDNIDDIGALKRTINKFGFDATKHGLYLKYYNNPDDQTTKDQLEQLEIIKDENQVVYKNQLMINGNDIKDNFEDIESIKIGKMLNMCLESVIDDIIINEKDELLNYCDFLISENII